MGDLYNLVHAARQEAFRLSNGKPILRIYFQAWYMDPAYRETAELATRTRPITVTAFFDPESQELSHIGAKIVDLEAATTFSKEELKGLTSLVQNPSSVLISEGDYRKMPGRFYLEIAHVFPYLAKELQKSHRELAGLDYGELAQMFDIEMDPKKGFRNIGEGKKVDASKVPDAYALLSLHFTPFVQISGDGKSLRLGGTWETRRYCINEIKLKTPIVISTASHVKSVDQQVWEALSGLKAYRGLDITQIPMIADCFLHFTDEPEFSSLRKAFARGADEGRLIDAITKWSTKYPTSNESYFPEPKLRLVIRETR